MGEEARCTARFDGQLVEGKAYLESEELIFRGPPRLVVRLAEVTSLEASDGQLALGFPAGRVVFDLGPLAEKWAHKIRNPRTLLDKLGVSPGSRVTVFGVPDGFHRQLAERAAEVEDGWPRDQRDLIFLLVETSAGLADLGRLRACIVPKGAIWVVHPRGRPDIRDVDVMAAAREAGLVDTKVARFSETHSALKLVIPRAAR